MATHRSKKHGQRQRRRPGNPARRTRARQGPPTKPREAAPPARAATNAPTPQAASRDSTGREPDEVVTEFYRRLDAAVTEEHPAVFLSIVSWIYSTAGRAGQAEETPSGVTDVSQMLEGHLACGIRGFRAAAYAMTRMVGTDEQRALVDRGLGSAVGLFPDWLQLLDRAEATEVWMCRDELRSTAAIGVGIRFATGQQATLVGVISLDLAGALLDAWIGTVSPAEMAASLGHAHERSEFAEISPGAARAQLEMAVILGERHAPQDLHAWPRQRSIIEWVLSLLPKDGSPVPDNGLGPREVAHVVVDFLRSAEADDLRDDPDTQSIVRSCLDSHDGWTDPLRWSALAVEILLLDDLPRWHALGREYLIKFPTVLAALIRYGHDRRGIDQERTKEALAAVEAHTPAAIDAIDRTCEPHGTAQGVAGRQLLNMLEAETAGEAQWQWSS